MHHARVEFVAVEVRQNIYIYIYIYIYTLMVGIGQLRTFSCNILYIHIKYYIKMSLSYAKLCSYA